MKEAGYNRTPPPLDTCDIQLKKAVKCMCVFYTSSLL